MSVTADARPPVLQAIEETLEAIAPEAFSIVAPFIARLYYAEQAGDTYINIDEKAHAIICKASPIVSQNQEETAPLILWQKKLFFSRLFKQEQFLAQWLSQRNTRFSLDDNEQNQAQNILKKFATEGLHEHQLQAIALSLLHSFLLICGGPGTGKTTTVGAVLSLLCNLRTQSLPRIALAAPTGKAASRMTEALENVLNKIPLSDTKDYLLTIKGQTLHRLLGINPLSSIPRFGMSSPLPYDIIIIDEASMLDLPMLTQLFAAVKKNARLILLGDPEQLPAIGAGNFVRQLSYLTSLSDDTIQILNQLLPQSRPSFTLGSAQDGYTTVLSYSHRFNQNSAIGQLAMAINEQDAKKAISLLQQQPLLALNQETQTLYQQFYQKTKNYWQAVEENNIGHVFYELKKLVVLTALKYQSETFNEGYIQYLYHKHHNAEEWFAGLPVMVTENDYQQNLFNGDIGIVMKNKQNHLCVFFESNNEFREIPLSRLPHFEPAFAITVHKSQGSEYEQVWLLAPEKEHVLFSRALFYTAVTRAKNAFTYWGEEAQIIYALKNTANRKSALGYLINDFEQKNV